MSKPTIAIEYGFGEDDWNGRVFVAELARAGFKVTSDKEQADVLVAHSAGCWYLPDTGREQLTVLIGPPYWPGRSLIVNFFIKFWRDFWYYHSQGLTRQWIRKTRHNTVYILGGLRKAIAIVRHSHRHDFYQALRNKRVLIIRAEYDAFLSPRAPELLKPYADFSFRTVHGDEHDSCWLYPEPYIRLIQSEIAKE